MGVFSRLRDLDTRVLGEPQPWPRYDARPSPPAHQPDAASFSGRLRTLDAEAFGEPLTRDQARAFLAVQRPPYSWRFAIIAVVAAAAGVVAIAGPVHGSVHFIVFAFLAFAGNAWLAGRFRRLERGAARGAISQQAAAPVVGPRRPGLVAVGVPAAAMCVLGILALAQGQPAAGCIWIAIALLLIVPALRRSRTRRHGAPGSGR